MTLNSARLTQGIVVGLLLLGLAGCGGSNGKAAGGGGQGAAMQAMPVQVAAAEPRPAAESSTYVASIQSRDSMMISPLVPGIIREILVRSGDSVAQGAPLVQIDASLQQAQVQNLENSRAAQQATLSFDQQQLKRAEALYEEKIGTLQDLQSAQSAFNAVKAQSDALDAQIRQAQVTLSYYRVTAPRAGIVGDIPVKVGDQVTTATQLTTLDSASGLEVYVQVPVEQAARLHAGLPVEVEDGQGHPLAESRLFFVSPQVDNSTQTILAKAALTGATQQRVRALQYVQAKITWSTHEAIQVPVLAVSRQGDSNFVFVAAPRGQGFYAHQVPVQLGEVVGNDYEITSGLNAGDKVIVSSTQIMQEGMPVMPLPPGGFGGGRGGVRPHG